MTVGRAIRFLLALASLLIVVWAFIDVGARIAGARSQRKIELTILHWGDPDEDKIVEALVAEYEASHPDIKIKRINPGGEFIAKLKTMFAAGTPPDLFYLGSEMLPELGGLKLLRPIDDHIEKEVSTDAGRKWLEDFYPVLLDAYRFDGNQVGKGSLYGLPKDFTTCVMYVNLDLFEKAGVPVPYDGWTFDEFEVAMKKIRALADLPEFRDSGRQIYGGVYEIWPASLLNIIWQYGGEYFEGADFHHPMLTDPRTQQGLELVRRTRLVDQTVFNATGIAKNGSQEFFTGNIGALGMVGRWKTPQFRQITSFRWDVVPMPHERGIKPASQIFTTAWTMAEATKYPDECYELMKFLTGPKGQAINSKLGLAIPSLISVANSDAFLDPDNLPDHDEVFLKAIPFARLQQQPRDAQLFSNIVQEETEKAIQTGRISCLEAGQNVDRRWLEHLNSPLQSGSFPPMNWNLIVWCTVIGLLAFGVATWWRAGREKIGPLDRAQARAGWMFILLWLLGFFGLTLGPMVGSALLSVSKWTAMTPLGDAQYVGVANYRQLFKSDPTFLQSLNVTAKYAILSVPIGQIAALAVALLMNSRARGISIFRTVYFVPSVISGAAMALLWLTIYNNDYGLLNILLRRLFAHPGTTAIWTGAVVLGAAIIAWLVSRRSRPTGAIVASSIGIGLLLAGWIMVLTGFRIATQPPNWFGVDTTVDPPAIDAARWAVPAFVLMNLWGVGGGMIIYLAGLKGIPVSYYEAATIDGAGAWRKLWNVTLPMLSPLIFFNFVMAIIGSFQVFTQAYIMTGPGPENSTLFYVLNLYQQAFKFHNMGYASAMAWILFLIVLVLTAIVFRGSRNVVYYEGLKA